MAHETLGNIGSYISYSEEEGLVIKKEEQMQTQQQLQQQLQMQPVAGQVGGITDSISAFWTKYQTWIILGVGAVAVYFLFLRKKGGTASAKRMYEFENPRRRRK